MHKFVSRGVVAILKVSELCWTFSLIFVGSVPSFTGRSDEVEIR